MNQTLQLTDYIPQYVSLYYVDYRDDLDEHEDIQEECIRSNNMGNSMKRHTNGMRNRKAQTCTTIWRRQERIWKRTI